MTDIGKEYGTAVFMLACEENATELYAQALATVNEAFLANPGYMDFLASPSIPIGERIAALNEAFANHIPEQVLSFLQLLCQRGRISGFFAAVSEYNALLDASKKVSTVVVTSATELDAEQKQKLIKKLESMCSGKVNAEYQVDRSLIGGMIIDMDGKVIDGSVRTRLQDIKEVMNT